MSAPQPVPRATERPFACTAATCQMAFVRREHLTRHMKTHTGERPNRCPHLVNGCLATFARSDELVRHRRLVHLEEVSSRHTSRQKSTTTPAGLADGDQVFFGNPRSQFPVRSAMSRAHHPSTSYPGPPPAPVHPPIKTSIDLASGQLQLAGPSVPSQRPERPFMPNVRLPPLQDGGYMSDSGRHVRLPSVSEIMEGVEPRIRTHAPPQ